MGTYSSRKISAILSSSPISASDLAHKLDVSFKRLTELQSGASPTIDEILRIGEIFKTRLHTLLEGEIDGQSEKPIYLVDRKAAASFVKNYTTDTFHEMLESYRIPGFSGDGILMFRVHGDSMSPLIAEDDFLICRKIESPASLGKEGIAVLVLEDMLLVKNIVLDGDNCILSSENLGYDNRIVNSADIEALWKVVGKVTWDFLRSSRNEFNRIATLTTQLQELQNELDSCEQNFQQVVSLLKTREQIINSILRK